MTTWNDYDRKDDVCWVRNDMYGTMKRRIAIVLHDAVNEVLTIVIKRCGPSFRLFDASICFN